MSHRVSSMGLQRIAVYGGESEQSTGVTSYKATLKCLKGTLADSNPKSFMILDEPDIGLSPRYAKAMGKHIAEMFNSMEDTKRLALVCHNPDLINAFLANVTKKVASLGIGTEQHLDEWLNNPLDADLEELAQLEKLAFKRHCAIDERMVEIRKIKNISNRV